MLFRSVALVAVVLVSMAPGEPGRRSGAEFGLAAGLAIGFFNVLISRAPADALFSTLAVVKLSSGACAALVIAAGRRRWRFGRSVVPVTVLVGLLDMAGNLVGVVVSKLNATRIAQATGDIPQNINFAVHGALARLFLESGGDSVSERPSDRELRVGDVSDRARRFTFQIDCRP